MTEIKIMNSFNISIYQGDSSSPDIVVQMAAYAIWKKKISIQKRQLMTNAGNMTVLRSSRQHNSRDLPYVQFRSAVSSLKMKEDILASPQMALECSQLSGCLNVHFLNQV